MNLKISLALLLPFLMLNCSNNGSEYTVIDKSGVSEIYVDANADELIKWAVNDFVEDLETISGSKVKVNYIKKTTPETKGILIGKFDEGIIKNLPENYSEKLAGHWEKYIIKKQGQSLVIAGSDVRGTVYGLFEVAKQIGISPWKWWADAKPQKSNLVKLTLPSVGLEEEPSVKYRGIFLNDEDWGLQPWAAQNFEPETGDIGPKTYEKIYQLLLRLKANCIWPAMHSCTKAFFAVEGNREMAEKYQICIGTSHAEPMLRNNVGEWDKKERGEFNYFTNSEKVKEYWQERISQSKNLNGLITLGMRGIHDSGMEGSATKEEKVEILANILKDQRDMLANTLHKPIDQIPQVFIPYKEVLGIYNNGLQVPDDITLMWTDDNYGYIRRLSNEEEQKRKGGSGVYYHLSYWGRPHDYQWLSTMQPGLIWYEMTRAYENGAKQIWIANVGDIKPAEYDMELFLDLAWDVNSINENSIKKHQEKFFAREFGEEVAAEIAAVCDEYYRLAQLRKPEYMGWSGVEPITSTRPTEFTSRNNNERQRRIDAYANLVKRVDAIKHHISKERMDTYFQLVEYPVKGAALINYKFLKAQQSMLSVDESEKIRLGNEAKSAYDEIAVLTKKYNQEISGGKWDKMMSMAPRNLPVFSMPDFSSMDTAAKESGVRNQNIQPIFIQAKDYFSVAETEGYHWKSVEGLGYSNASVTLFPFKNHLFKGDKPSLEYQFDIEKAGEYEVEIRCLPTHATNFDFKVTLGVNDNEPQEYPINTKGRSQAWKENVLRNAVLVKQKVEFKEAGKQTLKLSVNHTGIVIDQIAITPKGYGAYYEITNRGN